MAGRERGMGPAAVVLVWSASHWNRWNYRAAVEQVLTSGRILDRWDVGPGRIIRPGTEAWLLFHGSSGAGSGLIGHGIVVCGTAESGGGTEGAAPGGAVGVAFDALLPVGEQIPSDTLAAEVPDIPWGDAADSTLLSVPPPAESGLRRLWRKQGPAAVDPFDVVPGAYPPEAAATVGANRYERDADARRVCLAFHGTACAACGFSFEASYGDIGNGFIHVHHTVPAAQLEAGYELDPITDLVPLCANCHAMAHRGVSTPRTVQELRTILSAAGHLRGEVVTEQALEAQENARRLLEGRQD